MSIAVTALHAAASSSIPGNGAIELIIFSTVICSKLFLAIEPE